MYHKHSMLIIFGAGGHGKVCADIAVRMNLWNKIIFADENVAESEIIGIPLLNKNIDINSLKENADIFIAIGDNQTRAKLFERFDLEGWNIVTLIHPTAVIATDVEIDKGTVLMANTVINSSTMISKGCILNTACSVDHDNHIEKFVHISPGSHLAGSVKIGQYTWVGIGTQIINNVTVGKSLLIGAGSLVTKSIYLKGTYYGVPVQKVN